PPPSPPFPTRRSSDLAAASRLRRAGRKTPSGPRARAAWRRHRPSGAHHLVSARPREVAAAGWPTIQAKPFTPRTVRPRIEAAARSEEHTSELQSLAYL